MPVFESKLPPDKFKLSVEHINSDPELSQVQNIQNKVAVKMTCPLPRKNSSKFLEHLFIHAQVPVVIWTRCTSLKGVDTERWSSVLDDFFDWNLFRDKLRWLEEIKECRNKAGSFNPPEDSLGYHLSVLVDDPNRMPEVSPLDSLE